MNIVETLVFFGDLLYNNSKYDNSYSNTTLRKEKENYV